MSVIRDNAERDPNYRPYCMRCPGLVRMAKVAAMSWKCARCGAEHDERINMLADLEATGAQHEKPYFEQAGKVHDWRNHVSPEMQILWPLLSNATRGALYAEAERQANAEEWE